MGSQTSNCQIWMVLVREARSRECQDSPPPPLTECLKGGHIRVTFDHSYRFFS